MTIKTILLKLPMPLLQKLSDRICQHFEMEQIPVQLNIRLKKYLGLYHITHIVVRHTRIDTLLHELAHHLEQYRFTHHVKGYYKTEMHPAMEPCPDKPGWYAPTGKPVPIDLKIGSRIHGKPFKQCLTDIIDYYQIVEDTNGG